MNCPICNNELKKLVEYWKKGKYLRLEDKKVEAWDYQLKVGERVITGVCPNCMIKFLTEEEMR